MPPVDEHDIYPLQLFYLPFNRDWQINVNLLLQVPVGEKTESLILAFCEKLAKAPSDRLGHVCLRV